MTLATAALALLSKIATIILAHDADRIAEIRYQYRRFLVGHAQLLGLAASDIDNLDPTGALRSATTTVREDLLTMARMIADAENQHVSPSMIAFHAAWRDLYADNAIALGLTELDVMEIDATVVQYRTGAMPGDTVPVA